MISIYAVRHRHRVLTIKWFASWTVRLVQLCHGHDWERAKYDHLVAVVEDPHLVLETDPEYKETPVAVYEHELFKTGIVVHGLPDFMTISLARKIGGNYSILSNIVHLPIVGRLFNRIKPRNCVTFVCRLAGLSSRDYWLPCQFTEVEK